MRCFLRKKCPIFSLMNFISRLIVLISLVWESLPNSFKSSFYPHVLPRFSASQRAFALAESISSLNLFLTKWPLNTMPRKFRGAPLMASLCASTVSRRLSNFQKIPLPEGLSVGLAKGQLTLTLGRSGASRFRLAYGYVSAIKVEDSRDAGGPFCAQAILQFPSRYGPNPAERVYSWLYCRANACASCASA